MLKEHNREAYEATKNMLLKYRECCLVAGTGVGKTSTAIEIVKTCGFKTLVICHRKSIINSTWNMAIKNENTNLIDTTTYQYFHLNYNKLYGYDLYIFDEAHHMGSSEWSKSIKRFKENNSGYILGLTADANRYFEYQNIIYSMFNGHGVYGIQQDEAVEMGILPQADYVMAYFDTNGLYKSQEKIGVSKRLLGKLKYSIDNTMKINDILLYYTNSFKNIKGVLFVESIQSIKQGQELIRNSFPNESISYIHSKLSNKEITDTLSDFYNAASGFIIAVDMLNEGNHIPGLNIAIMLRKTSSPSVFLQQIGRILDINYSIKPVIFDFVGNLDSVERVITRLDTIKLQSNCASNNKKRNTIPKISNQLVIHDHVSSILSILKEIKIELTGRAYWSDDEIKILKENYPIMGRNVYKLLPGRSMNTCIAMAIKLGIRHNSRFTTKEDEILKENYPTMGRKVCELLPGRSAAVCVNRAIKLGLHSNYGWSTEEIKILKENYPIMGRNVYKLLPGKSASTCQSKASVLKITRSSSYSWSEEEIKILKENYPIMGINVYVLLPGRSKSAIRGKAYKLGLSFIK